MTSSSKLTQAGKASVLLSQTDVGVCVCVRLGCDGSLIFGPDRHYEEKTQRKTHRSLVLPAVAGVLALVVAG